MTTLAVCNAAELSSLLIPVPLHFASAMLAYVDACPSHTGYFAVYGLDYELKTGSWAVRIHRRQGERSVIYFISIGRYQPRKEGKADIVMNTM